jgi:hypothetical protein
VISSSAFRGKLAFQRISFVFLYLPLVTEHWCMVLRFCPFQSCLQFHSFCSLSSSTATSYTCSFLWIVCFCDVGDHLILCENHSQVLGSHFFLSFLFCFVLEWRQQLHSMSYCGVFISLRDRFSLDLSLLVDIEVVWSILVVCNAS